MSRTILKAAGVLLATISWTSAGAASEADLASIRQQLDPAPVVRGQFEQDKTLAGFDLPLRSSGRFCFSRDHGVIWQIEQPFAATVVITADHLRERDGDGPWRQTDSANQPAIAMIHRLSQALMGADLGQLREHFVLRAQTEADHWQLQLSPLNGPMAEFLHQAQVRGQATVQQLTLIEASGDRTEIRLQGEPAPSLSPIEARLLQSRRGD